MRFILLALLLTVVTTRANLQIIPVSSATQKELGLEFELTFETLTADLVQVQLTAERAGKLKHFAWPSVFMGGPRKTLLQVPLRSEPILTNQYSFLVHPEQLATTGLRLHCLPGGSAEVRYEIDLSSYASMHGILSSIREYDYLAAYKGFVPNAVKKEKLEKLKTAKVRTIEQARNAAIQYKGERGLDARDGSDVVALFPLSHDIEGFAREGDFIWGVKIARFGMSVSDEIWISSTTGKGIAMVAAKKAILESPSQNSPSIE